MVLSEAGRLEKWLANFDRAAIEKEMFSIAGQIQRIQFEFGHPSLILLDAGSYSPGAKLCREKIAPLSRREVEPRKCLPTR